MKAVIHTSDDYFQHYIPLFAYCFNRLYPSVEIHATIYGSADSLTRTAMEGLSYLKIQEDKRSIPPAIGRFLQVPDGEVIIADADILFTSPGLIEYCQRMAKQLNTCYYAAHGARKKPKRFEDSWFGDKERLCGAFVYVTQEWTDRTKTYRDFGITDFSNGNMKQEYREEDEVILCNICKMSNLPINQEKYFPLQHRGVHLGDFKPEMQHRFTYMEKMKGKLHRDALQSFIEMSIHDKEWHELKTIICSQDEKISEVFQNLYGYIDRVKAK